MIRANTREFHFIDAKTLDAKIDSVGGPACWQLQAARQN